MAWRKDKDRVPYNVRKQREQELHELIYKNEGILTIIQYELYHFRVFKGNRSIDVWPVRKKYYAPKTK